MRRSSSQLASLLHSHKILPFTSSSPNSYSHYWPLFRPYPPFKMIQLIPSVQKKIFLWRGTFQLFLSCLMPLSDTKPTPQNSPPPSPLQLRACYFLPWNAPLPQRFTWSPWATIFNISGKSLCLLDGSFAPACFPPRDIDMFPCWVVTALPHSGYLVCVS